MSVNRGKLGLWLVRHWRLVLFGVLIVIAAIAWRYTGLRSYLGAAGGQGLRNDILAMGWTGVLAFAATHVACVALGLPNLPFQLAAGAVYGVGAGFALTYGTVNLGALAAFGLARKLGRRSIEHLWGEQLETLNRAVGTAAFRLVLVQRLIPFFPFAVTNYAAGLSRMPARRYILANALGVPTLVFLHVVFGAGVATVDLRDPRNWLHPMLLGPLAVGAALLAAGIAYGVRAERRRRRDPPHQ